MRRDLAVGMPFFNPLNTQQMIDNLVRTTKHLLETFSEIWVIEILYTNGLNNKSVSRHLDPKVNIISLEANSLMWHKEQIMNYLGKFLVNEESYEAVAMFDADVIFENPDWHQRILIQLEEYKIVQCFSDGVSAWDSQNNSGVRKLSFLTRWFKHQLLTDSFPGGAWAARSEFWGVGFFEYALVGGGDSAFAFALLNSVHENDLWANRMNKILSNIGDTLSPTYAKAYDNYTKDLNEVVGSNMFQVTQRAMFQICGKRSNRSYVNRHQLLNKLDLGKELYRNEYGLTEWVNPKSFRVKLIRDYFRSRISDQPLNTLLKCVCIRDHFMPNSSLCKEATVKWLNISQMSKHFKPLDS